MKNVIYISLLAAAGASAVLAQPSVATGGVVNIASYAPVGLPSSSIAQGSMFAVFGSGMGPSTLQEIDSFPLVTTFQGTSLSVAINGTTVSPYVIYTSAGQLAAVMPSNTPTGTGTLTVTYNGQTSAPVAVTVVTNSFGVFTQNSQGTGPGSIADLKNNLYGLNYAALPGDEAVIWGTGLGPVTGSELNGALGQSLPSVPVKVWVGGTQAQIKYQGRSGCCAGIDQIFFIVPSGISGCYVPVSVQVGDTVSNYPTMSIGTSNRTCSDESGLPSSVITTAQQKGSLSLGSVGLIRTTTAGLPPPLGTGQPSTTDTGDGFFEKYTYAQFTTAGNPFPTTTIGACRVTIITGSTSSTTPTGSYTGLNAGPALTVNGPNGSQQIPLFTLGNTVGLYDATLGGNSGTTNTPLYLSEGAYTVTGPGGSDVGAFTADLTVGTPLVWTNSSSITTVTRANGQLITWTGGAAGSTVQISGGNIQLTNSNSELGAYFYCTAPASAGQFTIPAAVLLSVPPGGETIEGITIATGSLSVENLITGTFTAPGIDYGFWYSGTSSDISVTYQ